MCYNKNNNHMFADYQKAKDPVAMLGAMHEDTDRALMKFSQIKQLPEFDRIFSEGEKGSIEEIMKRLRSRREGIRQLQMQFD